MGLKMASKEAEDYTDNIVFNSISDDERGTPDIRHWKFSYIDMTNAFDAGVDLIITKLRNEFGDGNIKEDILSRSLDDYFSGCTHFCSNDEDLEKLFHHVINYFIRKC